MPSHPQRSWETIGTSSELTYSTVKAATPPGVPGLVVRVREPTVSLHSNLESVCGFDRGDPVKPLVGKDEVVDK